MSRTEDSQSSPSFALGDTEQAQALAIMVEVSPDGMILVDELGTMLLVNAQVERLFGYERSELIGRPVEDLIPSRHREIHSAHRTRYRVDPQPRSMGSGLDLAGLRSDGTEFPAEVSLAPAILPSGDRIIATVRDVSDRVETEARTLAVQRSIDAVQDGVFMFDPDTLRFVYVNQGAVEQLGYERDELLSMTPLHIKPEFTEQSFKELLQPLIDGSSVAEVFTTSHLRKDGHEVPVEIDLGYPPASHPSQPRMMVALVRDISERLSARQALEASEEALRTAFNAAPVGIAMVDFTDKERRPISDCNSALCELLGYSREELITKNFAELTYHEDSAVSDAAARAAADGTRTQYAMEKRYVHADGHPVWVWVHSAVLSDDDGNPTRGMVHVADLTDRKHADAERDRARRKLAALSEIRATALADTSLTRTLELVCVHAKELIGADTAVISRPTAGRDQVRIAAYDSEETRDLVPDHIDLDEPLREALAGTPFLSGHLDTDDRVGDTNRAGFAPIDEVTSALAVPIKSGDDVDALLMMSHHRADGFTETDLAEIQNFAGEAATVLQLHAARDAQSKLEVFEDRERLARDLHDLVIQRLFASGMALQSVLGMTADPTVSERVSKTIEQLDETIAELRTAIFDLNHPRPTSASHELTAIVGEAAGHLGFTPELIIDGDPEDIPGRVLEQVYPTLTEALSNVARHAQATAVSITLVVDGEGVALTVVDNGVGIDANAPQGNGLRNLASRASSVGGHAGLTNNAGSGTTFTWTASIAGSIDTR